MKLAGTFALRPSRRLGVLLFLLHGAVLIAPWLATLPTPISLLTSLLTAWGAYCAARAWAATRALVLQVTDEGALAVGCAGGEPRWVSLSPESRDMGLLVVLRWQEDASGQRGSVCLMADSLAAEDWRRLRAWLRWRANGPSSTAPTSSV